MSDKRWQETQESEIVGRLLLCEHLSCARLADYLLYIERSKSLPTLKALQRNISALRAEGYPIPVALSQRVARMASQCHEARESYRANHLAESQARLRARSIPTRAKPLVKSVCLRHASPTDIENVTVSLCGKGRNLQPITSAQHNVAMQLFWDRLRELVGQAVVRNARSRRRRRGKGKA